ncbi:MAG TPA: hypothetical protein DHW82_13850 [Spirochaetia bacterium]|nr:MAG: hypothetical protein A2Y41_09770 [Spirochaetes bacterium GWB1_36_13]HCL58072.1 hypothetical protein [Spirochaetia bacterium]
MKKNLILLGAAFVLLILVFVLPDKKETLPVKDKNDPEQMISIVEPELKSLNFKTQKETIQASKTEKGYLLSPSGKTGGSNEMMSLIADINSLEGFKIDAKDVPETDPRKIEASFGENKKKFLQVLSKREIGEPAYYVKSDKGIFVIEEKKIDDLFSKTSADLRNHNLTQYSSADFSDFTINKTRFYQKEEAKWFIESLKEEETDTAKVFTVFSVVSGMRIKGFTDSFSLKFYGLDKPVYTVALKLKDKPEIKLFFSKQKDKYYAYRSDQKEIFEIHETDFKEISKPVESFKTPKKEEAKK